MKETVEKQMIENIAKAIESISDDIKQFTTSIDNKERAEAIKALAEAYKLVKRGALK